MNLNELKCRIMSVNFATENYAKFTFLKIYIAWKYVFNKNKYLSFV